MKTRPPHGIACNGFVLLAPILERKKKITNILKQLSFGSYLVLVGNPTSGWQGVEDWPDGDAENPTNHRDLKLPGFHEDGQGELAGVGRGKG